MVTHEPAIPQLNYQSYNILIVDDTPTNLSVLVDYLGKYGFGIRIARSGETALKRVAYDAPDILLLDILLPGIDGFETCYQLNADPSTRDIPVIFMTSLASTEDKVRGFEVGAVDYVTKPLQQAEVLARVTTHLRMRDLTQNLQEENRQLAQSNKVEKERLFEAVHQQRAQLRTLNHKLNEVQERERQRLARELHDEMGQALTALRMNLAAIEKVLPTDYPARMGERLAEASLLTDQTLEQIRELSLDLRPPMLDDLGIIPTLRWYVKRFAKRMNIQATLEVTGTEKRLLPEVETALYRVMQEALTNVARHAGATVVDLHLDFKERAIVAYIKDDGQGFDIRQAFSYGVERMGMGLLGMRERITLLGGQFDIQSDLGEGTDVRFQIPLGSVNG